MRAAGIEQLEASMEGCIYTDEASRRRSNRTQRPRDRLATARRAQAESGIRIRIARPVANQSDFAQELKVWIPHVQEGMAARKSLGNLAMTLFDTNQQPITCSDGQTEESIREKIEVRYSKLFVASPTIEVTGIRRFGNTDRPFLGLTLAPGFAQQEQQTVRALVAPELALGEDYQLEHTLHVSLGQAFSRERAERIEKALLPVLPTYVKFGPADISVGVET